MKTSIEFRLNKFWCSNKGVCIEIKEQSKHSIKGVFYLKTRFLNKSVFKGIVSNNNQGLSFISFLELYIPEIQDSRHIVLKASISKEEYKSGQLSLCFCIYQSNNINNPRIEYHTLSHSQNTVKAINMVTLEIF